MLPIVIIMNGSNWLVSVKKFLCLREKCQELAENASLAIMSCKYNNKCTRAAETRRPGSGGGGL